MRNRVVAGALHVAFFAALMFAPKRAIAQQDVRIPRQNGSLKEFNEGVASGQPRGKLHFRVGWLFGLMLTGAIVWPDWAQALEISELKFDGLCKGLVLNGDIARNEAADFIKRMVASAERCGTRNIIVQSMPGGSVNDALAIGEAIRSHEYVTAMLSNSMCASACGLIYLGGVQRYWRQGARFVIHRPEIRVTTPFKSVAESDQAYDELKARLIRYVVSMGANPDYVDLMYVVPKRPGPSERTLERLDMMRLALFTHTGVPF